MRRIAIINQKGGVGKTTTAVNLGAALARLGRRVLVVDMDPQANASTNLGVELAPGEPSTYTVLVGANLVADAVRPTRTPGLGVLPAHLDLSGAELELAGAIGRESILRDALDDWARAGTSPDGVPPVDYVLLDNPPSLGLLSVNGLAAADEVLIAVQTEFFALQGLSKLVEVVQLLRRKLNPRLEITGVLACLYDSRLRLAREVLAELRAHFPAQCFKQTIGKSVKLAECPSFSQTIFEYAPESPGAKDHLRVAAEVIAREARDPELVSRALPAPDVEAVERALVSPAAASVPAPARLGPAPLEAEALGAPDVEVLVDVDVTLDAVPMSAPAPDAAPLAPSPPALELEVHSDAGPLRAASADAADRGATTGLERALEEALDEVAALALTPGDGDADVVLVVQRPAPPLDSAPEDPVESPAPATAAVDAAEAPTAGTCTPGVDVSDADAGSAEGSTGERAVVVTPLAPQPRALPVHSARHDRGEERVALPTRRGPRPA